MLAHLVHLCNLVIDDECYPVIDVIEHVKGAQVPRGVPRILVLDASLKFIKKVKPKSCKRSA